MLFNSYTFIFLFLPLTLIVYFILNKIKLTLASKSWLILCSLFFYSWWDIKYLPLIVGSIIFNFGIGIVIAKYCNKIPSLFSKKVILIFGIVINLFILCYFKYIDFFILNYNQLTNYNFQLLQIAIPLGISFFTFTQIVYLIDVYKETSKEYDFLNYSLFVTFFPHLLAGPIIYHKEIIPQFNIIKNKVFSYKNISIGLFLFLIGLFKKTVIADSFALLANNGFDSGKDLTFFDAWITSLSYTLQIYFDFSGYTDMALGSAKMFNIILPINFNSPYKAVNIREFWQRWHITLSRILRNYVYIPLGGNRLGYYETYKNLMIVFIIGGFWHGAGWTFVFWGCLHGLAMILHRVWTYWDIKINRILSWVITFNFVNVSWIFFRAKSMDEAIRVIKGMIGINGINLPTFLNDKFSFLSNYGVKFGGNWLIGNCDEKILLSMPICLIICFQANNSIQLSEKFLPSWRSIVFLLIIFQISIFFMCNDSAFLYFKF